MMLQIDEESKLAVYLSDFYKVLLLNKGPIFMKIKKEFIQILNSTSLHHELNKYLNYLFETCYNSLMERNE